MPRAASSFRDVTTATGFAPSTARITFVSFSTNNGTTPSKSASSVSDDTRTSAGMIRCGSPPSSRRRASGVVLNDATARRDVLSCAAAGRCVSLATMPTARRSVRVARMPRTPRSPKLTTAVSEHVTGREK